MVQLQEIQVEEILEKAVEQLKDDSDFQLVSITKKINNFDPFILFESVKVLNEDRIFWTCDKKELYLIGIGQVIEMIGHENRFFETKKAWEDILQTASIHNPYGVPGTGLVTLGGMAFDPLKPTTSLWEKYKPSHFTIPEFLLTKSNEQFFFTINIMVRKHDHPTQLANELQSKENMIFQEATLKSQKLKIQEKEEIEPLEWLDSVQKAKNHIQHSEVEKIVMAREMRLKFDDEAKIGPILQNLLVTQPNSYLFAFEKDGDCFVGATPERLVKLEGEKLKSTCLAGTAPRGKTIEEDNELREGLLNDPKNREEHEFVVQMIKEAINDYCTDLEIPKAPVVYPLKNLQHLYTPVNAKLKEGSSIIDIVESLHPTPALGGTPKDLALKFIREQERLDRGWYGAPIGWMDSNQNGEFAVAIRSALIQGKEAHLFAGCGVVKDSNPDEEYKETNIKFLPMLSVLGG